MTWGLRLACVHRASPPPARISITRHPLMMADEALAECRSGHPISPEASGMGEGFSHVAVSFTPPHRVQGVRVPRQCIGVVADLRRHPPVDCAGASA